MNACVIKLDQNHLYAELPPDLMLELLSDVVTRYESFFTFCEPHYPDGQPELMFKVLSSGYGLASCDKAVGIETVDLRAVRLSANLAPDEQWKDVLVGRILAATFASTINRP